MRFGGAVGILVPAHTLQPIKTIPPTAPPCPAPTTEPERLGPGGSGRLTVSGVWSSPTAHPSLPPAPAEGMQCRLRQPMEGSGRELGPWLPEKPQGWGSASSSLPDWLERSPN